MSLGLAFTLANGLAVIGWIILLFAALLPERLRLIPKFGIPVVVGLAYLGLMANGFFSAEGGYGSLDDVATLFTQRDILLAGWLHYIAFDLFVGAWITETALRDRISAWLVAPCLILTFLFGPVGLLAFLALHAVTGRQTGEPV